MGIHGHGTGICRGFTLLELLVTLTIAAILLVLGVPSLREFSAEQQLKSAVGNLHNDLLLARSEAVLRNSIVVACPGYGGSGCSGAADGWLVFEDVNGDRQYQLDEPLLRRGQVFEDLLISGSSGRTAIGFFPDGSAPGSNSSIAFCGAGGTSRARRLVISNVGRIRRDSYPQIDPSDCP